MATPLPAAGKIAFSAYRSEHKDYDIFIIGEDGSDPEPLTDDADQETHPALSPNGKKIAFTTVRGSRTFVSVMNIDGSQKHDLTAETSNNGSPAWSPDGKQIAFVSERNGHPKIYLMNADGSNQVQLSNDDYFPLYPKHGYPTWSPDGKKIAFEAHSYLDPLDAIEARKFPEIYLIELGTRVQTNLTRNTDYDELPNWSSQGKIVFQHSRGTQDPDDYSPDLYTMDADGSHPTRLTDTPDPEIHPAWSADGSKLVFSSRPVGEENTGALTLFTINADGSSRTRLSFAESFKSAQWPSWR